MHLVGRCEAEPDEVLHLEGGRIVDRGTHPELLARSPGYATLVNAYETEGVAP